MNRFEKYNASDLFFKISIDGNKDNNDKIRGAGTFASSIESAKKLVAHGFRVSVSTTVTSSNLKSIHELGSILEELNISCWKLSPIMPYGRARNWKGYVEPRRWNPFVKNLISV